MHLYQNQHCKLTPVTVTQRKIGSLRVQQKIVHTRKATCTVGGSFRTAGS